MKAFIITLFALLTTATMAQSVKVEQVRHCGPYRIQQPLMIDSVDAAQKKYSNEMLLETHLATEALWKAPLMDLSSAPTNSDSAKVELYLAGFTFSVQGYAKVEVKVKGPKHFKVLVNGKETRGEQGYQPGHYRVAIRYMADTAALAVELKTADSTRLSLSPMAEGSKRPFSLADNMEMRHYAGVGLSHSGRYARLGKSWFNPDGSTHYEVAVKDMTTGQEVAVKDFYQWMPRSDKYLSIRKEDGKRQLYAVDPASGATALLYSDLPEGSVYMSPTEDYLIVSQEVKGPQKEKDVYEILVPDDRQPNYRNRNRLAKIDLASGVMQPLTFGNKNVWVYDLSSDGRYMVFGINRSRLTQRPTSLTTVCRMDLHTLQVDTLVREDGFLINMDFIPGTYKLLVTASAEAFNRIGCTLPEDLIPNEFDYQLYLLDADTKDVQPLTRNFDPSIKQVLLSEGGQCFLIAENKDSVSLYQMNLNSYAISQVQQPCEVITTASLAANGSTLLYYGSGACTADRLYQLTLGKKNRLQVKEIDNINADRMAQIDLGTCQGYQFMSKNGYPISGHYYLPAHFDKNKQYPVIVHYYGGCSPTARHFGGGSHYPAHYWNANGYIVLVVNPGGASGFGQQWGARHVNTMGEGIAEDIIEATEWFARNPWVNKEKIGCVSASYGGFMTQLLLTKTDLFATGISHAGISDHTSYWGEGYWGYSYSEVSAAGSYPWTRKDLYVDRSPLYNADKIHKPLLFTHGTKDTNVPIGESIQMYTALKLLGVPTAFVMVEGENHGIMDFNKRQLWINTMVAWFNRWLQDDPSWWNAIYTPKDL